jgi:hypothetical protein
MGRAYTLAEIIDHATRVNGIETNTRYVRLEEDRRNGLYFISNFELLARDPNSMISCIQEFIETFPKKGKTCQAKTDPNKNSIS